LLPASLMHFCSGKLIHFCSGVDTARIWNAHTLEQACILKGHNGSVLTAEFSPDDRRVLTASKDSTARLWNAAACSELGIVGQHRFELFSASFDKVGAQ